MRQNKLTIITSAIIAIALSISMVYVGCGGGSSSSSSDSGSSGNPGAQTSFKIIGTLDGSSATFAGRPPMNFLDRFCEIFNPLRAFAVGPNTVTNIIAVCSDMTIISATHTANDFSLELPLNKAYIVVFLNGTNIVGLYKVDAPTDLDSMPVPVTTTASTLDIGDVSYDSLSDTFTAAITQTLLFNTLSLTTTVATAFGVVDNGLSRLSSLDVDGNGLLDAFETTHKFYDLKVQYQFDETEGFNALKDNYGITSSPVLDWYMYIGYMSPDDDTTDWENCYLNFPEPINGLDCITQTRTQSFGTYHNLNFASNLNSPATPPTGTYTITTTADATYTAKTYTFQNFRGLAVDPNLYDIYIPVIRLNMSGTSVASIDWQWWKNTVADGWVQPTEAELNKVLRAQNVEFYLNQDDTTFVTGKIGLTPNGTVVPPVHSFTPVRIGVVYTNEANYAYMFGWD